MSALREALEFCSNLVEETAHFDVEQFREMKDRFAFNIDKLPVGPEPTDELEAMGGFPPQVLRFVREVGPVTLNSSCYFGPNVELSSMRNADYWQNVILANLGLHSDALRLLGGDHGEGVWGLLTESGRMLFMEVDDDYHATAPEACFANFMSWIRVNFILGLTEDYLEHNGIDVYEDIPGSFSNELFTILSSADENLTKETWPYELLYELK